MVGDNIMLFIFNNDISEQSKRQMITLLQYIDEKSIYLDHKWKECFHGSYRLEYTEFEKYVGMNNKRKKVIFTNIVDGFKLIMLKKKYNLYIVFRPRGILPEESYYKNRNLIKKRILDLLEFIVCKYTDNYIFLNETQKKHYIAKYKLKSEVSNKSFVLPNLKPAYQKKYRNSESDKIKIVYSGGFSKWQHIDKVFKIFTDLANDNVNIFFTILTFENNFVFARELGKTYGISKLLEIKYVPEEKLSEELTKYNIGIIIRDNDIVNLTASPFKLIDYISSGLALIITDSIFEQAKFWIDEEYIFKVDFGNNGVLYNESLIKAFVRKIQRSQSNEEIILSYQNQLTKIEKIKINL